jgi:serine/threonine protein kinase
MLTGAPPFSGADLNAILFQIVNLVPAAPSTVNPSVTPMLDQIVAKALAKTPDDRYDSSKDLAVDLQQCRSSLSPELRAASMPVPQPRSLGKIDPHAATPLLSKSFPDARQSDAPSEEVGEATLGLAKDFDSLSAMVRLAAQTGVAQNFDGLVKAPEGEVAENATVYGTLVRDGSARMITGFDRNAGRWNKADRLIFAASVATATVAGVLILLS